MASAGLQIAGVVMVVIGWFTGIITCVLPMWRSFERVNPVHKDVSEAPVTSAAAAAAPAATKEEEPAEVGCILQHLDLSPGDFTDLLSCAALWEPGLVSVQ
ncbi:CLD6 protein, partial [Polypterus senegalus]